MLEQIMRVESADIRDNDHGGAVIEIALVTKSSGQSFILPVDSIKAYDLLRLFDVDALHKAIGKPIVVMRKESGGLIEGLCSLPCDPIITVMRDQV